MEEATRWEEVGRKRKNRSWGYEYETSYTTKQKVGKGSPE